MTPINALSLFVLLISSSAGAFLDTGIRCREHNHETMSFASRVTHLCAPVASGSLAISLVHCRQGRHKQASRLAGKLTFRFSQQVRAFRGSEGAAASTA